MNVPAIPAQLGFKPEVGHAFEFVGFDGGFTAARNVLHRVAATLMGWWGVTVVGHRGLDTGTPDRYGRGDAGGVRADRTHTSRHGGGGPSRVESVVHGPVLGCAPNMTGTVTVDWGIPRPRGHCAGLAADVPPLVGHVALPT